MPIFGRKRSTTTDLQAVAEALASTFETATTDKDGRIRVEGLLSAAAAVCGEACIASAGESDSRRAFVRCRLARDVHVAAPVRALAREGQILISSDTLAEADGIETSETFEVGIKGVSTPLTVASVSWTA